jgi:hypothetical protein
VYEVDDDADPLLRLLEEAISGEGIAGTEGNEFVVVLSPNQNNFAFEVIARHTPLQVAGTWAAADRSTGCGDFGMVPGRRRPDQTSRPVRSGG